MGKMTKKEKAINLFLKQTGMGWYSAQCVFEAVPNELYKTRATAADIVKVAIALNDQYQKGRGSTKAEVVDDNPDDGAVWVTPIGEMIEWKKQGDSLVLQFAK